MADPLVYHENGHEAVKERGEPMDKKEGIGLSDALLKVDSPEIQTFVRTMLEKSIFSLKPIMSFERGATYPEVSQIFGGKKSEAEIQSFLLQLASLGLLDKQIVDRIIACPSCKGTRVYSKYQCMKCHSFDVSAMQIIEHILCGYIGPKTSLRDGVICPQCKQKILSEKDYRSLGKTFGCLNCQYRFETPPVVHRCEDCGNVFSYTQANYFPVYEFTVSSKTREEFTSGLLSLRPVISYLREQGYQVESPKEVTGISGSKHRFDIVAHTGGLKNVLLGDFAFAPSDEVVIAAFAKKYDVNLGAKSFIVTYTPAPKNIDSVAKIYQISIICIGSEGKVPLEDQLERMLSGTPQIITASKVIPPSDMYLGSPKDSERQRLANLERMSNNLKRRRQEGKLEQENTGVSTSESIKKVRKVEAEPVATTMNNDLWNQRSTARTRTRQKKASRKIKDDEDEDYLLLNDANSLPSSEEEETDFLLLE